VIRLRAFRNGDPPALADLWNRGLPTRGVVRPLTPHEFDALIVSRLDFDAQGLILAEDDNRAVGFVHAGFGPASPIERKPVLDRELGTIAMLVVEPGRDDPGLEHELLSAAESYLRDRGAQVFYAGAQYPLNPFYWGTYGGSEGSGPLEGHHSLRRAAAAAGYEPVATNLLLEADLTGPEVRDPRAAVIKRQVRLEIEEDAHPSDWWEALALGTRQLTRFRLHSRSDDRAIAHASTWDMTAFGREDGRSRTGLIDFAVVPDLRGKGFGRFLASEVIRHARAEWGDVMSVQTAATNLPALALYRSLGFEPVETTTLYRKPGSRST
jgi:ribosomal protein S18 acetylase RimI-like enzyme